MLGLLESDFSRECSRSELRARACVTGTVLAEPSLVVLVCHPTHLLLRHVPPTKSQEDLELAISPGGF